MSIFPASESFAHTSPYFSLAREIFLRSPTPLPLGVELKHDIKSIIDVFGELSRMDDDSQAKFLLQLLPYSTFEPNFAGMAHALEIQQAAAIQRRFKAIVERNGYILEESRRIIPTEPQPKPQPVIGSPAGRKKTSAHTKRSDEQTNKNCGKNSKWSGKVAAKNGLEKVMGAVVEKPKSKTIKKRAMH